MSSEDQAVSTLDETIEPATEADAPPAVAAPEAAGPPEPEPRVPDPVADALTHLAGQLAESQRLIERQTEIAASLHAENQRLRTGELRQAQAALVISVLRVFDDISQMGVTAKVPESGDDLALAAEALADALARNGVERVAVEVGAAFDARAHKIAGVESTADPAADRTVARVVRPGFTWADGTVIRMPEVAVLRHTPDRVSA